MIGEVIEISCETTALVKFKELFGFSPFPILTLTYAVSPRHSSGGRMAECIQTTHSVCPSRGIVMAGSFLVAVTRCMITSTMCMVVLQYIPVIERCIVGRSMIDTRSTTSVLVDLPCIICILLSCPHFL